MVNQNRAWGSVHDLGSLIQAKQLAKKARMMARRDDQIGIEFTGRPRDLLGWFAIDKFFSARRMDLSKRLGQVSQGLLHHLPVVGQHSKTFLGYELAHLYRLINVNQDK